VLAAGGQRQARARLGEQAPDRRAESARRAGDDRDAPI
jgi:hypothetical protein